MLKSRAREVVSVAFCVEFGWISYIVDGAISLILAENTLPLLFVARKFQ